MMHLNILHITRPSVLRQSNRGQTAPSSQPASAHSARKRETHWPSLSLTPDIYLVAMMGVP